MIAELQARCRNAECLVDSQAQVSIRERTKSRVYFPNPALSWITVVIGCGDRVADGNSDFVVLLDAFSGIEAVRNTSTSRNLLVSVFVGGREIDLSNHLASTDGHERDGGSFVDVPGVFGPISVRQSLYDDVVLGFVFELDLFIIFALRFAPVLGSGAVVLKVNGCPLRHVLLGCNMIGEGNVCEVGEYSHNIELKIIHGLIRGNLERLNYKYEPQMFQEYLSRFWCVWKMCRTISSRSRDIVKDMLKGCRPGVSLVERREVDTKDLTASKIRLKCFNYSVHAGHDRRSYVFGVRKRLLSTRRVRNNNALRYPWRNRKRRDSDSESVERNAWVRVARLTVVWRWNVQRSRHVIIETAVLIEGNDKEGLFPLRRRTKGLVYILVKLLTKSNILEGLVLYLVQNVRDQGAYRWDLFQL